MKTKGLGGFYTGFGATLLRDVPAYAAFFATYELLKKAIYLHLLYALFFLPLVQLGANPEDEQSFVNVVFAGGIAGIFLIYVFFCTVILLLP